MFNTHINYYPNNIIKQFIKHIDTSIPSLSSSMTTSIYAELAGLSPELRNAVIGALIGLSVPILVQNPNIDELEKSWKITHGFSTYSQLKAIKEVLPINTAMITTIAKNVYFRRNRLTTDSLVNQISYTLFYNDNDYSEADNMVTISCIYALSRKWKYLTDIPNDDYANQVYINELVFNVKQDNKSALGTSYLYHCCTTILTIAKWLINPESYIKENLLANVIQSIFIEDLLSIPVTNDRTIIYPRVLILANTLLSLRWTS